MDFRRKSRHRVEIKPEYEDLEQRFPHNVMLYKYPPTEDINLQEFEDLALERLKVLRILEQANLKGLRFLSDDWKEYVNAEMKRDGLKGFLRLCQGGISSGGGTSSNAGGVKHESELQARRRDYISHFILRLAYCRTEELKRWFLTREMELFKYKFSALSNAEIKSFLELNKMSYAPLSSEQKDEVRDGLYESTMGQSVAKIDLLDFYKVPFTQVLDLVRARRCYLKGGFAYVTTNDFISIVSVSQMNEIEHGLQSAQKIIRDVETDERIFYLLKSLHTSYTGKDYTINKNAGVPIESLDSLSKKSFPLCMQACHEHLRINHHMKHGGRMQYGLFLKGIGVTLEDSLRFWREEFTKKIDADTFLKRYEYNIYHNYGKKGSMVNYTPYSCMKIIQDQSVSPGDVNGCPFKSYDITTLKTKLSANGLSSAHIQDVVNYVEKKHYQLACGKYFQIVHNAESDLAVNHPNQYFEESQILMGNRASKKSDKVVAKKRSANANSTASSSGTMINADEDDELWDVAAAEESQYLSQQAEKMAWDDDIDMTQVDC